MVWIDDCGDNAFFAGTIRAARMSSSDWFLRHYRASVLSIYRLGIGKSMTLICRCLNFCFDSLNEGRFPLPIDPAATTDVTLEILTRNLPANLWNSLQTTGYSFCLAAYSLDCFFACRRVIEAIDQSEFEGFEYINPLLMSAEDTV